MPFDTREKRFSMMNHGCRFWMGKAYDSNGAIDESHRFMSLCFYSGNSLVPLVPVVEAEDGGYFAMSYFHMVTPNISGNM